VQPFKGDSNEMKALVLDCETTGLISSAMVKTEQLPEVIEFYAAMVDFQKTGKLVQAPPFKQVAPEIFGLIERAPIVISHNIAYDTEVLDIEAKRLNYTIKWPPTICTVESTAYIKGDRLKLVELHEFLFKEKFTAHRAKEDVTALIRCCGMLYKQGVI
jgi:DNA polymerase III epsilon subunit-like protein